MGIEEELKKKVESVKEELEKAAFDKEKLKEFVEECVGLRRIQELTDQGWETVGYDLLITYGGPNIGVNTIGKEIYGYWGDYSYSVPVDEKVIEDLESFLDEHFSLK